MRTVASEVPSRGERGQVRPGSRHAALRKSHLRRLGLEALESRTLLAVLPAATVTGQVEVSADAGNEVSPSVAVDPNDPLDLVSVWTRDADSNHILNNGQTAVYVEGAYSTNGGTTWTALGGNLGDSLINFNASQTNGAVFFPQVTDASVAFDANHNVYILDMAHEAGNAAGEILLQKFQFAVGGAPVQVAINSNATQFAGANNNPVYQWTQDPAYKPTLAVDSNAASFSQRNSFTGATENQADLDGGTVGNVYVSWSTQNVQPANVANPNPNVIRIAASSDGGNSFTTEKDVNQAGNFGAERDASPQIAVSQGNGSTIPGGQVTVVYDDSGTDNTLTPTPMDRVVSAAIPNGTSGGTFTSNATPMPIQDATAAVSPSTINTPVGMTMVPVAVNVGANFTTLSDIQVTVGLNHNNLSELEIDLVSPAGVTYTLMRSQEDNNNSDAAATTFGNSGGSGLGTTTNTNTTTGGGFYIGTTFDDSAPRSFNLIASGNTTTGHFRPEGPGSLDQAFGGLTAAQVNGTWNLEIIDNRSSGAVTPAPMVRLFSVSVTSGLSVANNVQVATTSVRGSVDDNAFPLAAAADPERGIGPMAVIASDNTLGAYSQHQGRLYVAYVSRNATAVNNPADNTDIALAFSDNGGTSWTTSTLKVNDDQATADGFSEANTSLTDGMVTGRAQFAPQVAVDNSTGTLVLTWLDARDDAARDRVATYVTASIDGGSTFNPQVFVNPQKTAVDASTDNTVVIGPIPDNQSSGNASRDTAFDFGDHQGLAVAGGQVFPVWASNQNGGGDGKKTLDIYTAKTAIAAGPRIIASTQGPVGQAGDTVNTTRAADGTPLATAFVLTFDRPVGAGSFGTGAVQVSFLPAVSGATPILLNVGSVVPLNTNQFGTTRFRVTFAPPAGDPVGTYSYSIAPSITDNIPSVVAQVVPVQTGTFNAPANQVNLRIPPSGTGGSGVPSQDVTTSVLNVAGIPGNQVISKVTVSLRLTHTYDEDLIITLISPSGTRITLYNQEQNGFGFLGSNIGVDANNPSPSTSTTFDDAAPTAISSPTLAPPYIGTFKPDTALSNLFGANANGNWTLSIDDTQAIDTGTLLAWSLAITTGTLQQTVTSGNLMDQGAAATPGQGSYSVPTPTTGTPFVAPYSQDTLPLIVPGPHLIAQGTTPGPTGTQVPGNPYTQDNLVLNGTVNSLDVTFDRDMQVGSLSSADLLRVEGPAGLVTGPQTFTSTNVGQVIPDNPATPIVSTLAVPGFGNTFSIANLAVNLNITETNDPDLKVELIGPDGTTVTLINAVGTINNQNFTNTTLSDQATTTFAQSSAPFTGTFLPVNALAAFNGKQMEGIWKLRITDLNANGSSGTLNSWSLLATPNVSINPVYNATVGGSTVLSATVPANSSLNSQVPIGANGGLTIAGLRVRLDLTAPVDSVISATLSNGTTTIPLFTRLTGNGQDFTDTIFDDSSTLGIAQGLAPYTGAFRPQSPLSSFNGQQLSGVWTLAITNGGGSAATLNSWSIEATPSNPSSSVVARTFRVDFPTQFLSGTYTVQLGPGMLDARGNAMDTSLNAGVDLLRGVSATTQPQVYTNGTALPVPDATNTARGVTPGIATSTITVPDNFVIAGVTVQVDISDKSDPDLQAILIAPDGTRVILFSNVGAAGNQTDFNNTIFDDNATASIQIGGPPFFGSFRPQQSLVNSLITNHAGGAIRTVVNGNGNWQLELIDSNPNGITATLNSWSLTFQKPVPSTGLGETVADQTPASFRIFTMDPTNRLASSTWTAVGGASNNSGANSGRIGGIAVDPSDPSGNTVFVGGASGGIWKTTDFLTTSSAGPTYIPVTDFGPTSGINIGGIAVFPRNGDPNQSIVFAATGEGDTGSSGVGILRSMDGGATWTLLDSTDNTLPFNSPQRDHIFAKNGGSTSFKIVVDPNLTTAGGVIVYVAMSGGDGGIWRSVDSGAHWQNLFPTANGQPAQATDVVLDPASGLGGPSGNLQIVYAAIRGVGVFESPNRGQTWNLMTGGVGDPLIQDSNKANNPVGVVAPPSTPNGPEGRIVLAKPFLTSDPQENLYYEGWLYAAVITPDGHLSGVYLTKDFGANWTFLHIATLPPITTNGVAQVQDIPTNNPNQADYDIGGGPAGSGFAPQGNYDVSLAIDPTNPNITYLGGTSDAQPTGFIRIDATAVSDPYALVPFDENRPDGGQLQVNTNSQTGNAAPDLTVDDVTKAIPASFLNVTRNPNQPLLSGATQTYFNAGQFSNTGADVKWTPFNGVTDGSTDQHRIVTFVDPLTGHARIIIGDDQGVFSGVDNDGTFITGFDNSGQATSGGIGNDPVSAFVARNGNLQITQFYYGASQPSTSAATQIAGALFYGQAQDDGFPASDSNVLTDGNITWFGGTGDGTGVATDQQGKGTLYQYDWPCCGGTKTNFFQVNGIGRTTGLIQASNPGPVPDPQWPSTGGVTFTVNSIDGNQILISSAVSGRLFLTENEGVQWSVIGDPNPPAGSGQTAALDGSYVQAPAFGAPDPFGPGGIGNFDNFLYAGTTAGNIFVTQTGGGGAGNQWANITNGALAGNTAPLQQIIANPTRGSHEAYAVTSNGVYHILNSVTNAGQPNQTPATQWVNITGNLFQVMNNAFGNASLPYNVEGSSGPVGFPRNNLTSIVADWRYTITDATGTHPVLYAGGDGGVFRSLDNGQTWTLFPNIALDGAPQDGGQLPVADVTSLGLALGNVDVNTGRAVTAPGDPNVLLASTYGRGSFAIRLAPVIFPDSATQPTVLQLDPTLPPPGGSQFGTDAQGIPITATPVPVIDGLSEQTAFGNTVTINVFDPSIDPFNPIGTATTDASGNFKVQINAGVYDAHGRSDGVHNVELQAVDQSGTKGAMVPFSFDLNTVPPPPSSIALDQAADSGTFHNDNLTNFNNNPSPTKAPVFDVGGILVGATLELLRNGVVVNTIPNTLGGTVMIADVNAPGDATIADGTYTYTAEQINSLGNTSLPSPSTPVTIDDTPPAQPSSIALDPVSDTSHGAQITQKDNVPSPLNALVFDVGGVEVGATVELFRGGVLVNTVTDAAGGTVQIADVNAPSNARIPDGTYSYTATQIDLAGNAATGTAPSTQVTIVTAPPQPPTSIRLDPSTDTGTFNNDGITMENNSVASPTNAPLFDVAGIQPGATVKLFRNATLVATLTGTAGGTVPIYDTNNGVPGQFRIPDGTYLYRAEQIDQAGNISGLSPSVTVKILSTPPVPPSSPVLESSSDTGRLNNDGVTSANNSPSPQNAPVFDVSNVLPGATVELLRNGVVVNTIGDTTGGTVSIADINQSSNPANGPIPDASYTYTAIEVDLAGNASSPSNGTPIQIITAMPPVPSPFRLGASSDTTNRDTNANNSDGITQVTLFAQPVFDVSGVMSGATVNLYRIPPSGGLTLVSSMIAGSAGATVHLSDAGPSPDGTYTYEVQQVDLAGNASAIGNPITVVYLTAQPTTPGAPKLVSPSTKDNNGNIFTNVSNPTFNVAGVLPSVEPGATGNVTVDLLRDGLRVAFVIAPKAGGTVQITDPGPVPDGPHVYRAYVVDDANNISPLSGTLTVNFQPGAPAAPVLDASTDSGIKGDNITNFNGSVASPSNAPTFDISGVAPGSKAELLRNGVAVGAVIVGQGGPVKITDTSVPIADGTYSYSVIQVDASNNVSAAGPAQPVTIVTRAATPTSLSLTTGGNSTSSTSPTFSVGGVNLGETVNLYRGGNLVNSVVASASNTSANTATIGDPGPLIPGQQYQYAARLTDFAGNTSAATATLTVTVTAQAPAQPSLALDARSVTGTAAGVTNKNNSPSPANAPVFDVGGVAAGATVKLFRGGVLVNSLAGAPGGAVTIADLNTSSGGGAIPDGSYTYTVQQVVAGVNSAASAPVTVVIKSRALTPTLVLDPASNTGLKNDSTTVARRPTIDLAGADAGATLTLALTQGNTTVATLGPVTAGGNGAATFTLGANLGNGVYTVIVASRDNAGNTSVATLPTLTIATVKGDYNGDGKADLSVFRRVNSGLAQFFVQNVNPPGGPSFGSGTLDIPFQGDLDGDGKTDLILYRPSTATWYAQESTGGFVSFTFGAPNTDIPVVGNFDGTGRTEVAVYRPSTGQWFVGGHAGVFATFGGDPSDTPVPGNYDGAGFDQLALYRRSTGQWFIAGHAQPINFGGDPSDMPVPGDYDGVGFDELALYRRSTSQWFIGGHAQPIGFGGSGDIPAPGDYDGTGKVEEAVYRPSTAQWFIAGHAQPINFGGGTIDLPLAAPYQYRALNTNSAQGVIGAASVSAASYDFGATAAGLSVGPTKATSAATVQAATAKVAAVAPARVRPNQGVSKPAAKALAHPKVQAKGHVHDTALSALSTAAKRRHPRA